MVSAFSVSSVVTSAVSEVSVSSVSAGFFLPSSTAASATITTSAAMATYIQTFADFAAGSSNSSL